MDYNLNPVSLFFNTSIWKKKNSFFFSVALTLILFFIFPSQKISAQTLGKCVGSTSTQKYTGSMRPNDQLMEGQNLTSANGKFHLRVTTDGELVIEEILDAQTCRICDEKITMRAGREVWKAPAGARLKSPPRMSAFNVNTDCNLCFVSKLNQQWCITNGNDGNQNMIGQCDKMILTNDGRLVLIDKNRQEIWSNRSSNSRVPNNQVANNQDNPRTNRPPSNDNKFHISNADLIANRLNVQHNEVNTTGKGSSNQDKSNLSMGTYVCLNLSDGTATKAMIVGQGLSYGPKQDAYAVDVMDGPRKGQRYYLKPYQVDNVGDCNEAYIPSPSSGVPANLNLDLLEQKIITEINIIRANPSGYADELAKLRFAKFGINNNSVNAIAIGNDLMMRCNDNDRNCQNANLRRLQATINLLRTQPRSLPLLKPNGRLSQASSILASDRGSISGHTDSQGQSPACRAESVGYAYTMVGECLDSGYTTAAGFVFSLLNNPLHRNIILNIDANEIGANVFRHNNGKADYIRSVIMTGNNNYADSPGSCK